MKFLVGTMYCGENEFEDCVRSIEGQTGVEVEHFVVRDLPNKEAHDTLYRRFMDGADRCDVFVKVDADMVLVRDDLFDRIAAKFDALPKLKDLEIAVLDFFSDRLMPGMHAFRSTVTWQRNEESLFVDYNTFEPDERLRDDTELAPAARHCTNPSPFHAFHFGIHRALKVIQPGHTTINRVAGRDHWETLERTRAKFVRTGDLRIGLAVLGAEVALRGGLDPARVDYGDAISKELFDRYRDLDGRELRAALRRLAWTRLGFLGGQTQLKLLLRYHQWRRRGEK